MVCHSFKEKPVLSDFVMSLLYESHLKVVKVRIPPNLVLANGDPHFPLTDEEEALQEKIDEEKFKLQILKKFL